MSDTATTETPWEFEVPVWLRGYHDLPSPNHIMNRRCAAELSARLHVMLSEVPAEVTLAYGEGVSGSEGTAESPESKVVEVSPGADTSGQANETSTAAGLLVAGEAA